jgi:hypothetical protein
MNQGRPTPTIPNSADGERSGTRRTTQRRDRHVRGLGPDAWLAMELRAAPRRSGVRLGHRERAHRSQLAQADEMADIEGGLAAAADRKRGDQGGAGLRLRPWRAGQAAQLNRPRSCPTYTSWSGSSPSKPARRRYAPRVVRTHSPGPLAAAHRLPARGGAGQCDPHQVLRVRRVAGQQHPEPEERARAGGWIRTPQGPRPGSYHLDSRQPRSVARPGSAGGGRRAGLTNSMLALRPRQAYPRRCPSAGARSDVRRQLCGSRTLTVDSPKIEA